jgi:hypothetical protein
MHVEVSTVITLIIIVYVLSSITYKALIVLNWTDCMLKWINKKKSPLDFGQRQEQFQWFLRQSREDSFFTNRVLFTDKAEVL